MLVKKNELIDDLKRVMPGIETKSTTLEFADSFIFTDDNKVYSYNSTVSVMVKLSQELKLSGAVQAIDFYNCVEKMPDDFELTVSDDVWNLKCGKVKAKINLLITSSESVNDRFVQLEPTENWIDVSDGEFYEALTQCNMPKNDSKYSGVIVGGNKMISTDGLQINKFELKDEFPEFWISNKAVGEILKWNDFVKVQLNKTWLQFTNNSVVFSVKTIYSKDISEILSKVCGGLEKMNQCKTITSGSFNNEIYEAIDRASIFSENIMNKDSVVITFEGKDCTVSSKRKSGEFNESVDIGLDIKEKISFALALNMMVNVSKYYKDFILIENSPNPPRLMFKNGKSIHLVATLKM